MPQDYNSEYTTQAEHDSGMWAEEPRASEVRMPQPWERGSPGMQTGSTPHHLAARGLAQVFGLHPALALFVIIVDAMVSAVDVATLGISAPVLWLLASVFTGAIVFMGQKKWYDDDQDSALIKSLIVGVLTALPTPLPAFLTVPSAIVGAFQILRNRK